MTADICCHITVIRCLTYNLSDVCCHITVIRRLILYVMLYNCYQTSDVRYQGDLDSRLRQTADVNLNHVTKFPPYFPFTLCCFYTKISSLMPVSAIGIVRGCFYLFIFYFEKFSA